MKPAVTLLNGMLGIEFGDALQEHRRAGIHLLDLKDHIFGKSFADLSTEEARGARQLVDRFGLEVYSLSSMLCHDDVEQGEMPFRQNAEALLERVLTIAPLFKPVSIRLLSAWSSRRGDFANSTEYLDRRHAWIYDVYRDCVDRLTNAGYTVFIENEAHQNIFSNPAEIRGFFERLNCGPRVRLTWDVQNLWQTGGAAPSIATYKALDDLTGYVHLKGGRAGSDGKLAWASSLRDATWPVEAIVKRVVADGAVPVFCINPPHGQHPAGFDSASVTADDIRFLHHLIERS